MSSICARNLLFLNKFSVLNLNSTTNYKFGIKMSTCGQQGQGQGKGQGGEVEKSIREKLTKEFQPKHLEIVNESYMHNVPKGSETHFKVLLVSQQFVGKKLIERHRQVNQTLKDELSGQVHALSIVAKTLEQWEQNPGQKLEQSPACRGGFGK